MGLFGSVSRFRLTLHCRLAKHSRLVKPSSHSSSVRTSSTLESACFTELQRILQISLGPNDLRPANQNSLESEHATYGCGSFYLNRRSYCTTRSFVLREISSVRRCYEFVYSKLSHLTFLILYSLAVLHCLLSTRELRFTVFLLFIFLVETSYQVFTMSDSDSDSNTGPPWGIAGNSTCICKYTCFESVKRQRAE